MAILPIDLQALLVRMDSMGRQPQEGVAMAQTLKASELGELAQLESSRVNQIDPHPDGNSKIEDEQKKEKRPSSQKRGRERKRSQGSGDAHDFEEPYKGNLIDTTR